MSGLWQRTPHEQTNSESHLPRAERAETACAVELLGVRVTDDVQRRRARRCRGGTAILDQGPANTLAPRGRLDKKPIQFPISVRSRKDGSKAHDSSFRLGNEYFSGLYLSNRQFDRIGIRQQRFSISGIAK